MNVLSSINWSDLQKAAGEASIDAVPADVYDVFIDTATAKQASTGKDGVVVVFKIENGPHAGRKIFNNFWISPENQNALAFFFRHMNALGLNEAFFAAQPSMESVAKALVGRRARVNVTIRQYNEQDQNDVKTIMPPLNGAGAVATPAPAGTPAMPSVTPAPVPAAPNVTPAPVAAPAPAPVAAPAPAPVTPPTAFGVPTVVSEVPAAPKLPF